MAVKYVLTFHDDMEGDNQVGLKAQTVEAARVEAADIIWWPSDSEYDVEYQIRPAAEYDVADYDLDMQSSSDKLTPLAGEDAETTILAEGKVTIKDDITYIPDCKQDKHTWRQIDGSVVGGSGQSLEVDYGCSDCSVIKRLNRDANGKDAYTYIESED